MSARSRIGILNDNGTVTSIYCHYDGYPINNGAILTNWYTTEEKIRELMNLGDLSILGKHIGVKHDFDSHGSDLNQCLAYGRDRGDIGIEAMNHANIDHFFAEGEEYNYLWQNNRWSCTDWENQEHDLYSREAA